MVLTEEKIKEMEAAAKPLVEFLCDVKTFHPHMKIIVECNGAEILEASARVKIEEFIKD